MSIRLLALFLLVFPTANSMAGDGGPWNGRRAAVVLTYDDALNVHLDNVVPALNRHGFRGTFYLTINTPAFLQRTKDWRSAAAEGHELGNHTLFHPCAGNLAGREWVSPDYDLGSYTRQRMQDEILVANKVLESLDGRNERTFAYTCGDRDAGGESFVDAIRPYFVAARGVSGSFSGLGDTDLFNVNAFGVDGQQGGDLIARAEQALSSETMVVFLFHGVGGEHPINVSLQAHNELLAFLAQKREQFWVTTLREAGKFLQGKDK